MTTLTSSIRAIQGCTDMLRASLEQPESGDPKEFLDLIQLNSKRAETAVEAADTYRKLARTTPVPEWVQLDELVQESVARKAPEALAYLALDIPAQCRVQADPMMCKLVVDALVTNALQHTHSGSKPLLFFRRVLEMEPHVFVLGDNGTGVSQDIVDGLFGHFTRGPQSSPDEESIGMGLAIVRMLTEKHGGKVWMESRVDDGTRLFFHFGAPGASG